MQEEQLVPELRFPEFEEDWVNCPLSEFITALQSGVSVNSLDRAAKHNEKGVLKTSCASNGIFYPDENKSIIPSELHRAKLSPKKDSIIISRMNTPALVGEIGYVDNDYKNLFIPDRLWITKTNENIIVKWLSYALITPKIRSAISSIGTGTSGSMKNISKQNFLEIRLFFPSINEQQKIASFLTAIDRRIQLLQQKKVQLETYKKGVMQKLFSQEIRFKDEEGNDFPDWEEKRLGEVATFSKGRGISKSDISVDGSIDCIRYGELYTYYNEVIEEVNSKTNLSTEGLVFSESNDVIIPSSGETQVDIATASCVLKSGVALGGDLNIMKTSLNGVFLSYYLNHARKKEIARLAQGISVVHLYSSQLKTLTILVPSLAEQEKIISLLVKLQEKILSTESQIQNTTLIKKGLLQKMFV